MKKFITKLRRTYLRMLLAPLIVLAALTAFPQQVFAVNITIDAAAISSNSRAHRAMVFTTPLIGYFFFIDADADFSYIKTTDGGASWTGEVEIDNDPTITALAFDVWYDKWTPGDSGTKIHIWWVQIDVDDILYKNLDTSTDTLSAMTTPFAGGTGVASVANSVSGTKARGGNLYVAGTIDAAAECEFARSTDGGATWDATLTSPLEACGDQGKLFPGNETDTQDIWMLYDDIS